MGNTRLKFEAPSKMQGSLLTAQADQNPVVICIEPVLKLTIVASLNHGAHQADYVVLICFY